jgi:prephenate dehydrogenase
LKRVAVVGTGLIGGSVALGLKAAGDYEIAGYDPDRTALAEAVARGAIDERAGSPAAAAEGADLVILAVPVDRMPETCTSLAPGVGLDAVVTDVGSAKVESVAAGEAAFGDRFVGGHPMAGSEQHGIEAADPLLFQDAWWILTPTAATAPAAYNRVVELATTLGAQPIALDPGVHDSLVARLSHIPQLAASTLVDLATSYRSPDRPGREALLGLAGAGFRDVQERLSKVEELMRAGEWEHLGDFLADARKARMELFAKPVQGGETVELHLLVPDRAGVLAEVTTAAGRLGVNIEDLRIIHSTEGGRGRLELLILGPERAAELQSTLEGLGYHVELADVD